MLIFGWVLGAERGVREMNRGADFHVPGFIAFMIRFVTPTFLVVILVAWAWTQSGSYIDGMSPSKRARQYEHGVYTAAITAHFADEGISSEELAERTNNILGFTDDPIVAANLPVWLQDLEDQALAKREEGKTDAIVAQFVFIGIGSFFILLIVLTDIACRNRIGHTIRQAEQTGVRLEEICP